MDFTEKRNTSIVKCEWTLRIKQLIVIGKSLGLMTQIQQFLVDEGVLNVHFIGRFSGKR